MGFFLFGISSIRQIETLVFPIKILFIGFDVLCLGATIYAIIAVRPFLPKFNTRKRPVEETPALRDNVVRERWQTIARKFSSGTPDAAREAVVEADALVDAVLKNNLELPGEHLADRLASLESEDVATLNRVWRAHRMRNDLVHTPGFTLSVEEAQNALDDYEAFLKEMGILENPGGGDAH